MFDIRQLSDSVDFRLVPSVDDMLMNENLKKDFEAFVPREMSRIYEEYFAMYSKILSMPCDQRGDEVEDVVMLMAAGATKFKELEIHYKVISKGLSGRKSICDSPFTMWLYGLTDSLVTLYYREWVDKRVSFWSKEHWNPAREAVFSRLSISYSAGDASSKTESTEKRGFGGFFSRKKKTPVAQSSSKSVLVMPPKESSSPSLMSPGGGTISSSRSRSSASLADVGDSQISDLSDVDDSSSVTLTVVPTIPTLLETLSSVYLRKMLQTHYLETHLTEDDMILWKKFSEFMEKYQPLTDDDIESCQDEMRASALEILDKHETFMKKGYFLRSHIQKKGLVTSAFFRQEEVNLLRSTYSGYENFLRQRGWIPRDKP